MALSGSRIVATPAREVGAVQHTACSNRPALATTAWVVLRTDATRLTHYKRQMPLSLPLRRCLKWTTLVLAGLLALPVLLLLSLALFGANWARGPVQDLVLHKTGRLLLIGGDIGVTLAWPQPRVRAQALAFANPAWAAAPHMLTADAVEASIDLPQLLRGRLVVPELRLERPRVFLEQGTDAAGALRKTWLFDKAQTDDDARIPVGRVLIDRGEVSYLDPAQRTDLRAELSTDEGLMQASATARTLAFKAQGRLRGVALAAQGSGGAVLRWRDEGEPYPLQITATLGRTHVRAEGTVTGLLRYRGVDLQLALRGDDLAALYPLLGLALPHTPPYRTAGRLLRTDALWRYEAFTGRVGQSDLAGTLQVVTGGPRPVLSGTLASRRLDLADLGPAVGARDKTAARPAEAKPAPAARVLPDLPFDTARWASLDADITLTAQALLRPDALPLDGLTLRLRLNDRQLTLDPFNVGLAGGQLRAQVRLDGRAEPLQGRATLQLRGAQLTRLLPAVDLRKANVGRLDGDAELSGQGASVGRLLATATGRVSLVAQDGLMSRLLLEQMGLHVLEIVRLNLTGDVTVPLRCAVADFGVNKGVMEVRALVLDTAVNTVTGSGRIDLAQERVDLSFVPRTKVSSLLALRSPIHLRGSLAQPVVALDTAQVVTRGLGALALGLINPWLVLVPLIEAGPGADSPCAALVREAQTRGTGR